MLKAYNKNKAPAKFKTLFNYISFNLQGKQLLLLLTSYQNKAGTNGKKMVKKKTKKNAFFMLENLHVILLRI